MFIALLKNVDLSSADFTLVDSWTFAYVLNEPNARYSLWMSGGWSWRIATTSTDTPALTPTPNADGIQVIYNGSPLAFEVAPQMMNGRTMVPLRAVFEAMGATIEWDGSTQTATATRGDTVVILTIGNTSPTVNGQVVTLDQAAVIVDGRTLAPLRFVAEAFGGTVEWDGNTQTATITN